MGRAPSTRKWATSSGASRPGQPSERGNSADLLDLRPAVPRSGDELGLCLFALGIDADRRPPAARRRRRRRLPARRRIRNHGPHEAEAQGAREDQKVQAVARHEAPGPRRGPGLRRHQARRGPGPAGHPLRRRPAGRRPVLLRASRRVGRSAPRARARRPRPQVETGKHFADQKGLDDHKKSRAYKRRVKELKEDTKYSQTEAEIAAGMSVEVLPKMRDVRAAAGEAAPPARPTPMEA